MFVDIEFDSIIISSRFYATEKRTIKELLAISIVTNAYCRNSVVNCKGKMIMLTILKAMN